MRFAYCGRSLFAAAIVFGSCWFVSCCQAAEAAAKKSKPAPADNPAIAQAAQFVHEALAAEANGQPDQRAASLKRALEVAPDFAPAHWQSGEVQRGDRWLTVDSAAKEAAAHGKIDQYRAIRDQAQPTYDDQMSLATWCAKQGLRDQERAHLVLALMIEPNSREAMSKLGLVRYRGVLMQPKEIARFEAQRKQWNDSVAKWKGQLTELRSDAQSKEPAKALAEIRALRDPAAIPGIEIVLSQGKPEVGLAAVDALAQMPEQAATESLVRHAVFSPHEDARQAAAYALRSRDRYSYLPLLFAGMNTPIETRVETYNNGRGRSGYQLTLFREGTFANFAYSQTQQFIPNPPDFVSLTYRVGRTIYVPILRRLDRPDPMPSPETVISEATAANEQTARLNERIAAALATTTHQDFGVNALRWSDWWYDDNEYYTPDEPPTYTQTRGSYPAYGLSYVRRMSCFVAGTLVWTLTGPMRIEEVKVGECLLSQDPETGELSYKPVLATTVRPASPLIETRVGNTVIRSTRGHPFWVSGIGWQMAKQLKAGQWLHTPRGPVLIDSAESSFEAVCYNLVVADFNNYFVSDAQVLVHDNNLRGPNTATVPGLAKEWAP